MLQQDCYYRDSSHLPWEERVHLNYDEPAIFDHDLLLSDIQTLIAGKPITRKAYDFSHHMRADHDDELLYPPEVLILEGIHCFHDSRLRDLMFLKIYMKV